MKNAYSILMGKPEGRGRLGDRRWEDNIKGDLNKDCLYGLN
jgi:hypothetical protein